MTQSQIDDFIGRCTEENTEEVFRQALENLSLLRIITIMKVHFNLDDLAEIASQFEEFNT